MEDPVVLLSEEKFWQTVLEFPIQLNGAPSSLGLLLSGFINKARYAIAMRRYGIECTGFSYERPQFDFDWTKNARLDAWLTEKGYATATRPNRVRFKAAPASS